MRKDHQEQFVYEQCRNDETSKLSLNKTLPPQLAKALQGHLKQIQELLNDKIIRETFEKSLPQTLIKKGVIKDGQLNVDKAVSQGTDYTNSYIDKLQKWLNDSIFTAKRSQALERYKEKKKTSKQEKIKNISNLIEKIADKMKKKALNEQVKIYASKIEKQRIVYKQNEQINSLMRQMKDLDVKLKFEQENLKKLSR